MIVLITGASHTGKTLLSQKILEKYHYPYFSADHLKMGLIRSGCTDLTPEDDAEVGAYIWPILREIIKTAVENRQNLVIEGAYIPFDWQKDFDGDYIKEIRFYCLAMSREYIVNHFRDIKRYADVIENRIDDSWCTKDFLLTENAYYAAMCKRYDCNCIMIDNEYRVEIEL